MVILAALLSGALTMTATYRAGDRVDNRDTVGLGLEYWASDSRWGFRGFVSHKAPSLHTNIVNAYCAQGCSPGPGEQTFVSPRVWTLGGGTVRAVTGQPWVKDAIGRWVRTSADPVMGLVALQAGVRLMDFPYGAPAPTPGTLIPTATEGTSWFIRPAIAARWYPTRALALEMGCSYELSGSPRYYHGFQPHFSISAQF